MGRAEVMELRWYITAHQDWEHGDYTQTRVLQYRPNSKYEWTDVDKEFGPEIRFDGRERIP